MQLSIIVTAYNSEETIAYTLQSIKCQMRDDIEVLIINDGSTDSTEKKIEENLWQGASYYAIKNNGVSNARNFGLILAKGKYIWFIDSDDFIEERAIENVINLLKHNSQDVIMSNYIIIKEDVKERVKLFDEKEKIYNSHDEIGLCCEYLLDKSKFENAIWKNIYKREFLIKNNLYFDTKLFMNEDGNWLFEVLINANSLLTTSYYIYIYNMSSPTSITKKKQTLASYKCSNYVYTRWYLAFDSAFSSKKINEKLKKKMSNGYANSSSSILSLKKKEKVEAIEIFLANIKVVNDANNLYGRILKIGRVVGYRTSLRLAYIVYKFARFVKK